LSEISNKSIIAPMTPDTDHRYDGFIDGFAHLMAAQRGVPLVGGRIFAYLLVCEPAEQTAAENRRRGRASLGTVSSMTRLLLSARLIDRVRRRASDRPSTSSPRRDEQHHPRTLEATRFARQMTDRGLTLMADRRRQPGPVSRT